VKLYYDEAGNLQVEAKGAAKRALEAETERKTGAERQAHIDSRNAEVQSYETRYKKARITPRFLEYTSEVADAQKDILWNTAQCQLHRRCFRARVQNILKKFVAVKREKEHGIKVSEKIEKQREVLAAKQAAQNAARDRQQQLLDTPLSKITSQQIELMDSATYKAMLVKHGEAFAAKSCRYHGCSPGRKFGFYGTSVYTRCSRKANFA